MTERDSKRFEAALNSAEPEQQLIELVEEMKREGLSQVEIYFRFEERLRPTLNDADERYYDALTNVMDCIIGFCAMDAALFAHYLTNEQIEKYRERKNPDGSEKS